MRSRKIQMLICILAAIFVLAACSQAYVPGETAGLGKPENQKEQEMDKSKAFMGKWVVTERLITSNISAVSDEDFEKDYLNKKAEYTDTGAQFGEAVCKEPVYKEGSMSAEQFTEAYKGATFEQLGIDADSVKTIAVFDGEEQWSNPGSLIIIKDENTLITCWDGAFFKMERVK